MTLELSVRVYPSSPTEVIVFDTDALPVPGSWRKVRNGIHVRIAPPSNGIEPTSVIVDDVVNR